LGRPRHTYEYAPKPDSAATKIVRMAGPDKRVLELGPGPGSVTQLLSENGCRVTAVEVDQSAIDIVAPYCERVVRADLNCSEWKRELVSHEKFDVIVAADVLEHLTDPWGNLFGLPDLLKDGGCIIISLPNLGHNGVVASLVNGYFEYQPWGLLDRTHVRFFGVNSIQSLFEKSGLKIVAAEFVVRSPEQTEFARHWRQIPEDLRASLNKSPFGNVYQVVVKGVPSGAPGAALKLTELAAPTPPRIGIVKRFRTYLMSFLTLETRSTLSRLYERIAFWR
jgi:2-polyprenyl-3-methyl-5-hydroxy-6-metoxy-1,4-benzoquinol methylase